MKELKLREIIREVINELDIAAGKGGGPIVCECGGTYYEFFSHSGNEASIENIGCTSLCLNYIGLPPTGGRKPKPMANNRRGAIKRVGVNDKHMKRRNR